MARKHIPASERTITQGGLALLLCEAILHVLVERRTLDKGEAIEAIDSVADMVAGLADPDAGNAHAKRESLTLPECAAMLKSMRLSFQAHD